MKKILTIAICCLSAGIACALPVDETTTQRVATRFWQEVLHGRGEVTPVGWRYGGLRLYSGPGAAGYVIVSAADCARPVLAYSLGERFDTAAVPPQLASLLASWDEQVTWAVAHRVEGTSAVAAEWQRLLDSQPLKEGESDAVSPLLTSQWDQQPLYNTFCPSGTPVGCGPTALSQVMRYWNQPAFGQGSHSYLHPLYGTLSADFGHTLYDWSLMPDQLGVSSSSEEVNAVATLMYHVGVSCDAEYDTWGTPMTFSTRVDENHPLRKYFHYSSSLRAAVKGHGVYTTDQRWADTLAAELRRGHPIMYVGVCAVGGHGWVCDGYQWQEERQYFHMNFGWSGRGDGYYTIDSICPPVSPTGEDGEFLFNQTNAVLMGIVPDYRLHVSDNLLMMANEGGSDTLLFSACDTSQAVWSATSDQPWLTVDTVGTGRKGWVRLTATANGSGSGRIGVVTFRQGDDSIDVRVMQDSYTAAELCPLTVTMEATDGNGWQGGAHLRFESESGYIYGTASLESGREGSTTVLVAPHDIKAVWVSGGQADKKINYRISNRYGEELVNVVYAYRNGSTHRIEWPCAHAGIDGGGQTTWSIRPNPATDHVTLEGLQGENNVTLLDLNGRTVTSFTTSLSTLTVDLGDSPRGVYLLRVSNADGVVTEKVVKQ